METMDHENAFRQLNYSASRIANAYHDAARRLGLSDSELDILYTLCTHAPGVPRAPSIRRPGPPAPPSTPPSGRWRRRSSST